MRPVFMRRVHPLERDEEEDLKLVEFYYEGLNNIRMGLTVNECGLTVNERRRLYRWNLMVLNYGKIPVHLSEYCLRLMRVAEKKLK